MFGSVTECKCNLEVISLMRFFFVKGEQDEFPEFPTMGHFAFVMD